jgi:hypothetical protein
MRKLTSSQERVKRLLHSKYKYFMERNKLAKDGSFFTADGDMADYLNLSARTIKRARERLQELGDIKFTQGKCRGLATKYWLYEKPDKMSPFQRIKPDHLSKKPDRKSGRGGQNVSPNREIDKKIDDSGSALACPEGQASPEDREANYSTDTIRAMIKFLGEKSLKKHLMVAGYTEEEADGKINTSKSNES